MKDRIEHTEHKARRNGVSTTDTRFGERRNGDSTTDTRFGERRYGVAAASPEGEAEA